MIIYYHQKENTLNNREPRERKRSRQQTNAWLDDKIKRTNEYNMLLVYLKQEK